MSTFRHKPDNLDELLKRSLQTDEQPSIELNNVLKAKLQEKENKNKRKISLWYLPMLLNTCVFIIFSLNLNAFIQSDIVLKIMNSISVYFIVTGVGLTIVGMKFSNLKEALTFEWSKGGSSG